MQVFDTHTFSFLDGWFRIWMSNSYLMFTLQFKLEGNARTPVCPTQLVTPDYPLFALSHIALKSLDVMHETLICTRLFRI